MGLVPPKAQLPPPHQHRLHHVQTNPESPRRSESETNPTRLSSQANRWRRGESCNPRSKRLKQLRLHLGSENETKSMRWTPQTNRGGRGVSCNPWSKPLIQQPLHLQRCHQVLRTNPRSSRRSENRDESVETPVPDQSGQKKRKLGKSVETPLPDHSGRKKRKLQALVED